MECQTLSSIYARACHVTLAKFWNRNPQVSMHDLRPFFDAMMMYLVPDLGWVMNALSNDVENAMQQSKFTYCLHRIALMLPGVVFIVQGYGKIWIYRPARGNLEWSIDIAYISTLRNSQALPEYNALARGRPHISFCTIIVSTLYRWSDGARPRPWPCPVQPYNLYNVDLPSCKFVIGILTLRLKVLFIDKWLMFQARTHAVS